MASSSQNEVFKVLRESQNKYVYFLLAIAGAAIAFALNQTQDAALEWNHLPIGVGILCWGVSFYFGCVHMNYVNSSLYANFELLKVQSGQHPQVGRHPDYISAAREGILEAIKENTQKSEFYGRWQFRLISIGAIFYIIWHVIEMSLRSI